MNFQNLVSHHEEEIHPISGWTASFFLLGAIVFAIFLVGTGSALSFASLPLILLSFFLIKGFFIIQPNEARVCTLFGNYKGSVRESGFHWINPFYSKPSISLRVRNFNTEKLKVNDKRGNPVEIAAVVVWRVLDTAKATFDVENYERFVTIQAEVATRKIASMYTYDHGDDSNSEEKTLQNSSEEVSQALKEELYQRLAPAGIEVDEANLTHLAYAPEIAQAMLRRQQAEAVIAARKKIVHGAVSMVEMALESLAEKNIVQLDNDKKAAMVGNLLVVLCGENDVVPTITTG